MQKKKHVNINLLSLVLNYFFQILECLKKTLNSFSFTSKLVCATGCVAFALSIIIIHSIKPYLNALSQSLKRKKPNLSQNQDKNWKNHFKNGLEVIKITNLKKYFVRYKNVRLYHQYLIVVNIDLGE